MAFPYTPTKRPYERNPSEPNGRGKWQKTSPSITLPNQSKVPVGAIVFRMLCPASKTGSIIGKGGGIVAKIRQETGAKIRIEETVPGCEERVVVITGLEKDVEVSKDLNKEDNEENSDGDGGEDVKASEERDEGKEDSAAVEGSKSQKAMLSAQKALMLVFERIIEGETENDGGDEESKKSSSICVRLLVLSSQVGCLLGIGGSVIKQMSADSGAQIRILPKDKLPLCASPQLDEIVQIIGGVDSVKKALQLVSQQLLENPPRDSFPANNPSGTSSNPFTSLPRLEATRAEGIPLANHPFPGQGPPFSSRPFEATDHHSSIASSIPKFADGVASGRFRVSPEPITFRLLCSNDKVGSVIGKGGSIIKAIQHETTAEIKIHETTPESDDRIIAITGPVLPEDNFAPPQVAIFRVQERIVMALPDKIESTVLLRLVVASNQTGCLLGKGGAIIAEMRKLSGAHIRILGKDQVPNFVSENDEVVQVTGEPMAVHNALVQITTKLKYHLFRDKIPSLNPIAHPAFIDQVPPHSSYIGRRDSPPRMYPNLASSFQNYDSAGHPLDDRSAFPIHGSLVPPHGVERIPPSPWAPQGMREGGGPLTFPDHMGRAGPQRRIGGFPGGTQSAVITNTTVDVVVPRALVPSIYGEDGGCLKKIREISEARITITEPRPEATETVIIISGTPEQTHAAQSLIQAFVMCGSGSP